MSEKLEELTAALLEQRDALNFALGAMHRTHTVLLKTLESMAHHPLDPNTMPQDQLNTLAERLWTNSSLESTVTSVIDNVVDDKLGDAVHNAMSSYVENLEIEIECSASIRDNN